MHEHGLIRDLLRKLDAIVAREGAKRVRIVRVRLGALSHLSPEHFLEHFERETAGTCAEGATAEVELATDPTAPDALGVVLVSVDVEG